MKFDVATGTQAKSKASAPQYTKVFAESLIKEACKDDKIVAITAAKPSGTGLDLFEKEFPHRCFDVGIAEQHAVTFAGGIAAGDSSRSLRSTPHSCNGTAIRSCTILPSSACRSASQSIARAWWGADGPTHAGAFDVTYLGCLPGFVLMAAADEADLVHMVATAAAIDDRPSVVRYPRGEGLGVPMPAGRLAARDRQGPHRAGGRQGGAIVVRRKAWQVPTAARQLKALGLSTTVADARFAKPLDVELVSRLVREHEVLITIEEGGRRLRRVRPANLGRARSA